MVTALKAVAGSGPGAVGRDPKMRSGPGGAPSRSLGMAAMRALISASRGSLKKRGVGGVGEEGDVAGELAFDGGDAVLADAERVVAAEGERGVRGVEVQVGDGHEAGEARDFDGLRAGVVVGVALEDPGLVEGVHGAPLGFAVDAEVVGDVGVDERAADVPLVLGVGDRDEQVAAAGVRDGDLVSIQKGAITSWPL